jgi:DNA-binding beta-propeller fold protein YncE
MCLLLACAASPFHAGAQAPAAATRDYLVYVASEAVDSVSLVRFGPRGISVERQRFVGISLTEQTGPHGISVSPDRRSYFVTAAHGEPAGYLMRFNSADDRYEGGVRLGLFPATAQVSPDGHYVYVSNFNLWGDAVPSSISIVAAEAMAEITRVETCVMPHGSRFTRDGRKHYSTCMMNDALIEIDTRAMNVSRYMVVAAGREMGMTGPVEMAHLPGAGHDMSGHGMDPPRPGDGSCQPTWAQPNADGSRIWVACSKSSELLEVDAAAWQVLRRIPAGPGIYNLAVTNDGKRVIGTNRRDQSASVFDAVTGRELARIRTTHKVVSGVAVSDDDRYAFVTAEGTAGAVTESGTLDVIDLAALKKVATIRLGAQAGGVDFFKSERVAR